MQQRRLRLGDILDDYCPRERRITNHAVVAMVGDAIQQTRCTTCDAEHPYKGAQLPRRRKKDATAAPYDEVLARAEDAGSGSGRLASRFASEQPAAAEGDLPHARPADEPEGAGTNGDLEPEADEDRAEDGPVHRPLIRATLPRIEGQPPARPAPEFTIRSHNGNLRGDPNAGRRGARGPGGPRREHQAKGGRPRFPQHAGRRGDMRSFPSGPMRQGRPARHGKKRSS